MQTAEQALSSAQNGRVSAVHPTETKEACHAIQALGSPDYPGADAGPGPGPDGCRLQQQFQHVRCRPRHPQRALRPPRPPRPRRSAAPSSPGTGSSSAAVAQITANWEKFFNSSTPAAEKVTLLQNGSTFAAAIKAFASFPLASALGAKVTAVTLNSATSATVTYSITASGGTTPAAQPDRHGGLPGRGLEGRRRQPLRPVQAGARRHGASRVQFGRLRQGRSVGQPGGGRLR